MRGDALRRTPLGFVQVANSEHRVDGNGPVDWIGIALVGVEQRRYGRKKVGVAFTRDFDESGSLAR